MLEATLSPTPLGKATHTRACSGDNAKPAWYSKDCPLSYIPGSSGRLHAQDKGSPREAPAAMLDNLTKPGVLVSGKFLRERTAETGEWLNWM